MGYWVAPQNAAIVPHTMVSRLPPAGVPCSAVSVCPEVAPASHPSPVVPTAPRASTPRASPAHHGALSRRERVAEGRDAGRPKPNLSSGAEDASIDPVFVAVLRSCASLAVPWTVVGRGFCGKVAFPRSPSRVARVPAGRFSTRSWGYYVDVPRCLAPAASVPCAPEPATRSLDEGVACHRLAPPSSRPTPCTFHAR